MKHNMHNGFSVILKLANKILTECQFSLLLAEKVSFVRQAWTVKLLWHWH